MDKLGCSLASASIRLQPTHGRPCWQRADRGMFNDHRGDQACQKLTSLELRGPNSHDIEFAESWFGLEVAPFSRTLSTHGIRSNPAADTEPDESANKADKNPLLLEDMRAYWQKIKVLPGFIGHVLRLHLLTGGQRLEQLCNLLTANVAADYIILLDDKGRPGKPPRPHVVPLIGLAATAMRECKPSGVYAISTDGGKTHVSAITLSHWACAAAEGIFDFKTKRLRSGVETLLTRAQIMENHRGHLQSHGLSGVQRRHYDGHNYIEEKRHTL